MLDSNVYPSNEEKQIELLKPFLYCKECKHKIGMQRSKVYPTRIRCSHYNSYTKLHLCTPHNFFYEELEKEILDAIRIICLKYVDSTKLYNTLKEKSKKQEYLDNLNNKREHLLNTMNRLKERLDMLYEDRLNGTINAETYKRIATKQESELKSTEGELDNINKAINEDTQEEETEININLINDFLNMENINAEILAMLIDKIDISQEREVDIHFRIKGLNYMK